MANFKHICENELIGLLQQSDHSAYNEIYHRYFQLIFAHIYKKIQDEDQAKDIAQEVFATLWFKRETAYQIKNLAAYLFTVSRNKIFDLFAHQSVQQKYLDSFNNFLETTGATPADFLTRERNFQNYINKEIAKLPQKMRVIFEMSRKDELSYQEIAQRLETSENNVSKQVNNAVRILRTKLGILIFLVCLV